MISEKDTKLTINKMWQEIKNMKLEQNNVEHSVYVRIIQIVALMKILQKEEIFSKEEIQKNAGELKQSTLTEVRDTEFTDFVDKLRTKEIKVIDKKGKTIVIPKPPENQQTISQMKVKEKV